VEHLVYTGDEHHEGAQVVDIDSDGDLDIISIGWTHSQVLLYENMAIIVGEAPVAPSITVHPTDQTVTQGQTATFSVVAEGTAPLSYQWQRDGTDIPAAISPSYTTPATTLADDGTSFRCTVSNAAGSTASNPATLTVTPAGTRVTDGLLVLYTFHEGSGTTVHDVSTIGTPLDLTVDDPSAINWVPGGLAIHAATLVASEGAAAKVIQAAQTTNELTIEAWLRPANTSQDGPARIVTLSADPYQRNLTLGQGLWGSQPSDLYDVRLRTTATSLNGTPSLYTPAGSLTTELAHVVYTRDTSGLARTTINSVQRASRTVSGDLSNWNLDYCLALANELTGDRPWLGEFYLVAIFDRALSSDEVTQNFLAGPE